MRSRFTWTTVKSVTERNRLLWKPDAIRPVQPPKEEAGFDPSQPRDESGRWSDGGGTGGSAPDMGDGSGAGGTSPSTAPPANPRQEILQRADKIKFTDEEFVSTDVTEDDYDEIEESMTSSEYEAMQETLTEAHDEYVRNMVDDMEFDVDHTAAAEEAGYSRDDISSSISEIVADHEELAAIADDWTGTDVGLDGIDDLVEHLNATENGIPPDLQTKIDEYRAEAARKIDDEVTSMEDEMRHEAAQNLDTDDYDDTGPRREYLREFYRDNEERFASTAESAPKQTWYKDPDGRQFNFDTSDGRTFNVGATKVDRFGLNGADITFSDDQGNFKITGKGAAFEVFGNVVPAVVSYIKNEDPDIVTFSAAGKSRQRLYDRLVSTVLGTEGGRFAKRYDSHDTRFYVVGKNEHREKLEKLMSERGFLADEIAARSFGRKAADDWTEIEPNIDPAWFTPEGWEDEEEDAALETDVTLYAPEFKSLLRTKTLGTKIARSLVKAAHRQQYQRVERDVAKSMLKYFRAQTREVTKKLFAQDWTPDPEHAAKQAKRLVAKAFDEDKWNEELVTAAGQPMADAFIEGAVAEIGLNNAAKRRKMQAAFNPDQPRDPDGRFASGGGGSGRTEEQASAIREYTDESNEINLPLREGGPEALNGRQREIYDILQPLAKQSLPEPVTVYRGVQLPGDVEDTMTAGNVVSFPGFSSSSFDLEEAKVFGRRGVMLEIQAKTGIVVGEDAATLSSGQKELIQAHGTSYRVIAEVDHNLPGHRRMFKLEEVAIDGKRFVAATKDADDDFDDEYGDDIDFPTEMPAWLREAAQDFILETFEEDYWLRINETTRLDIEGVLYRAIEDGKSIRDIAKEIQERTGNAYSRARATNVARTETTGAMSRGHVSAMHEAYDGIDGIEPAKEWLSILGTTTRDEHAAADGQQVPLDADFEVGGEACQHPGDARLSAAMRCNCACSIVSSFVGEGIYDDEPEERGFNPDQPRDDHGRWAPDGGDGSGVGGSSPSDAPSTSGDRDAAVTRAVEKLNSLPSAPEGYAHFGNEQGDEVRMTEFGFNTSPDGLRIYGLPTEERVEKIKSKMVLDPSKEDMRYAQSSVIRSAVERKIKGEDPDQDQYRSRGLPLVVKEEGVYYLQNGHHRAAADVLVTGKVTADVIEVHSRTKPTRDNPRGRPKWGKVRDEDDKGYNPDQPRDESGRWSSGGGGGGGADDSGGGSGSSSDQIANAPARAPRGRIGGKVESWDVTAQVDEVAKAWGYPKDKIAWKDGPGHEFEVNGEKMTAAGYCDLKSGKVTIYTEALTEGNDDPIELAAHEIMHGVYEHVSRQYEIEQTKAFSLASKKDDVLDENMKLTDKYHDQFPVLAAMQDSFSVYDDSYDKFAKEDGVTDYSKQWWKEQKGGNATTHMAIHETLAEIAAHEARTGKVVGRPHYKKAYESVKKAWVSGGGKRKKKAAEPETTIDDRPPTESLIEYSDVAVFVNRAFTVVPKEEAEMVISWTADGTLTYGLRKPHEEQPPAGTTE